jgi:hypothetical protein
MSRMFEALLRLEKKPAGGPSDFGDDAILALQDHAADGAQSAAREPSESIAWHEDQAPNPPAVAPPMNLVVARTFDAAMILIAFGVFLGFSLLVGDRLMFNGQNAPIFAAILALVAFFYWFLWALAIRDTPGACFAQRGVVDLENRGPQSAASGSRRLKVLEDENHRLKQMLADLKLDKETVKAVIRSQPSIGSE